MGSDVTKLLGSEHRSTVRTLSFALLCHCRILGFSTRGLGLSVFLRTSVARVPVPSVRLSGGFFPNTDHKQQQQVVKLLYFRSYFTEGVTYGAAPVDYTLSLLSCNWVGLLQTSWN